MLWLFHFLTLHYEEFKAHTTQTEYSNKLPRTHHPTSTTANNLPLLFHLFPHLLSIFPECLFVKFTYIEIQKSSHPYNPLILFQKIPQYHPLPSQFPISTEATTVCKVFPNKFTLLILELF
jgi:hypothetical protein